MRTSTLARAGTATIAIAAGLLPAPASAGAGAGDDIVLRRDGTKAVQVPANAVPSSTRPSRADAFDWGDAGLGAGVATLVVALGTAGAVSLRRHGPRLASDR